MNTKIIDIIKKVAAYMYLYILYFGIFSFLGYYLEVAEKPMGTFWVIMATIGCLAIYFLINHRLIKHIIRYRTLIIVETLLISTLIVLFICYAFLWAEYGCIRS